MTAFHVVINVHSAHKRRGESQKRGRKYELEWSMALSPSSPGPKNRAGSLRVASRRPTRAWRPRSCRSPYVTRATPLVAGASQTGGPTNRAHVRP